MQYFFDVWVVISSRWATNYDRHHHMHGCDVKQKETTSLQNDNHYWAIMSIMGNKHPFLGGDFFSKNEFWALLKAPPLALL